jgi:hypothetical protein
MLGVSVVAEGIIAGSVGGFDVYDAAILQRPDPGELHRLRCAAVDVAAQ